MALSRYWQGDDLRLFLAVPAGASLASLPAPARLKSGAARAQARRALVRGAFTTEIPVGVKTIRMLMGVTERFPRATSRLMFKEHERFDRSVARRLPPRAGAVIGLPNASVLTFAAAPRPCQKILHMVNGHPLEHNRVLLDAGVPATHRELIPNWVIRRVSQELACADLVLAPSRVVLEGLVRCGVPAQKVQLHPYGVDTHAFAPRAAECPRDNLVLYVGQISWRKGVHVLLEAARAMPTTRFRLAGPVVSPEMLRTMPANVRYLGRVSPQEVAELMSQARVFVMPSLEDAYPLAALEAIASGCSLVATTAIGTSDLVTGRPGVFLVPPGNQHALRVALEQAAASQRPKELPIPRSWRDYAEQVQAAIERLS